VVNATVNANELNHAVGSDKGFIVIITLRGTATFEMFYKALK